MKAWRGGRGREEESQWGKRGDISNAFNYKDKQIKRLEDGQTHPFPRPESTGKEAAETWAGCARCGRGGVPDSDQEAAGRVLRQESGALPCTWSQDLVFTDFWEPGGDLLWPGSEQGPSRPRGAPHVPTSTPVGHTSSAQRGSSQCGRQQPPWAFHPLVEAWESARVGPPHGVHKGPREAPPPSGRTVRNSTLLSGLAFSSA